MDEYKQARHNNTCDCCSMLSKYADGKLSRIARKRVKNNTRKLVEQELRNVYD